MRLSNLGSATYAFIAICVECTLHQANGKIWSPNELNAIAGHNVTFMFNSNVNISAAKFGLDNGQKYLDPKFITVILRNGETKETCGEDLDKPKAAKYKGRVFFVGDLSVGHAWFNITNVTVHDTKRYMASICEDGCEGYEPQEPVHLSVKTGRTSPPNTSEPRFNKFEGVGEKAFSSHITLQEEQQIFHSFIKKAYENAPGTYEISIPYFRRKKELWIGEFDIVFTIAKNRTYAWSFLQKAMANNQLGGYNITCFKVSYKPDLKAERAGKSTFEDPYLIAFFVFAGLVVLLIITFIIILMCRPDLIEPFQ